MLFPLKNGEHLLLHFIKTEKGYEVYPEENLKIIEKDGTDEAKKVLQNMLKEFGIKREPSSISQEDLKIFEDFSR